MGELATTTIRLARRFRASPARAFDAWLDPSVARRWLFTTALQPAVRMDIRARVPGRLRVVERQWGGLVEHRGDFHRLARPHHLVFSLSVEGHPGRVSRVFVDIAATRTGCEMALTHAELPRADAARMKGRWIGMLYGLGLTLASLADTQTDVSPRLQMDGRRLSRAA
jgi:uncharacterized protein YndB with AHSA1/START domain